ncbi:MAG: hypothetical protein ACRDMV_25105 [Streptosporangiales bacterium]
MPKHAHILRRLSAFAGRHRNAAIAVGLGCGLVVSGASGAVAASKINGSQIRPNSVRAHQLHSASVRGHYHLGSWAELKGGTIGPYDLAPNTIALIKSQGGKGGGGLHNPTAHSREAAMDGPVTTVSTNCEAGQTAVAGGFQVAGAHRDAVSVKQSGPVLKSNGDGTYSANGWTVVAAQDRTPTSNNPTLKAYVVCASMS